MQPVSLGATVKQDPFNRLLAFGVCAGGGLTERRRARSRLAASACLSAVVALSCEFGPPGHASGSDEVRRESEQALSTGLSPVSKRAADSVVEEQGRQTTTLVPPSEMHNESTSRGVGQAAGARRDDRHARPLHSGDGWQAEVLWRAGTVLGDERLAW